MIKRVASTMLVFGVAHALVFAEPAPTAPPLLKVTYGEIWGPSPLMYSYSVWPTGEVRYEPLPLDYNGVKTRQPKTLRITPEAALRAVNELIKVGFLALAIDAPRRKRAAESCWTVSSSPIRRR